VERVLDIHARGIKIKKFLDVDVLTMLLLQKKVSWRNTCVDMHIKNHMFLIIP
jgi:hypothetical protein